MTRLDTILSSGHAFREKFVVVARCSWKRSDSCQTMAARKLQVPGKAKFAFRGVVAFLLYHSRLASLYGSKARLRRLKVSM